MKMIANFLGTFMIANIFFFLPLEVVCQGQPPFGHSRILGLGSISSPLTGLEAAVRQPAALANLEGFGIGLDGAQYYWLPEVRTGNLIVAIPTSAGSFGFQAQYFGFEAYNESVFGLSYARLLGENVALGGRFLYLFTRIPEYGTSGLATFDLGMQYKPGENLTIGVSIYNPIQIEWVPDEYLPNTFRVGGSYSLDKKAILAMEVEKTLGFDTRYRAGVEYFPVEPIAIRMGIQSNPSTFSIGIGWKIAGGVQLDLASQYHQQLGLSPSVGLSYQAR